MNARSMLKLLNPWHKSDEPQKPPASQPQTQARPLLQPNKTADLSHSVEFRDRTAEGACSAVLETEFCRECHAEYELLGVNGTVALIGCNCSKVGKNFLRKIETA